MSLSTRSVAQPTVPAATPEAPSTLRNVRRLTADGPDELLMRDQTPTRLRLHSPRSAARTARVRLMETRSVVTGCAVIAHLTLDVTVDAPPHVQRCVLEYTGHLLHLTVTRLAAHVSVHVTLVRELYVVRNAVNALPRDRQ